MARRIGLAALLIIAAVAIYAGAIEPYRVVVREVAVPSAELARFFDGATVVHLSDLHTAGIGRRERRLLDLLQRIDPDYVFVTGDYVREKIPPGPVLEFFRRLPAKEGVWGVLGNVDYTGTRESCGFCHVGPPEVMDGPLRGSEPIRMLRNERVLLERGGRTLELIGLDEIDGKGAGPDPKRILYDSSDREVRIVLAHTPFLIDDAARAGVELYLAGDTHGGQIALPTAILERVMPDKHWRYRAGRFRVGETWLNVHHGIGWSLLPFRLGYPPLVEILRFEEAS